jgi:hypothetical protein
VKLANIGTRPHPGGGSGRHRRPKAEVAEARGIPPPPNKYLFAIIFYLITLTFPAPIVLFYTVDEIPFFRCRSRVLSIFFYFSFSVTTA